MSRAKNYARKRVTAIDTPTVVSPLLWGIVESALLHASACNVQLTQQEAAITRLLRDIEHYRKEQLRLVPKEWEQRAAGHPNLEKKL